MKKTILGFVLAMILSWLPSLRAETMLVEGDAKDIPAAVHAAAFGPKTILLLTQQLSEEAISLLLHDGINIDALVLKSGGLADAAIATAASKEFRFDDIYHGGEVEFSPDADSLYEIYLDTAETATQGSEHMPPLSIWINHHHLMTIPASSPEVVHERYKKIGQTSLTSSRKYSLCVKNEDKNKNNGIHGTAVHLLLVEAKKKDDFRKILSKKIQNQTLLLSYLLASRQGVLLPRSATALNPPSVLLKIVLFSKVDKTKGPDERLKLSEAEPDSLVSSPLLRIGNTTYTLAHFEGWENFLNTPKRDVYLEKNISLPAYNQPLSYKFFENPYFGIRWAILDFAASQRAISPAASPEISFVRINPTKCLIHVTGATRPFWLIFSETFHKHWKLFSPEPRDQWRTDTAAIADYPLLKTKEGRHAAIFEPKDIAYLRKTGFAFPHIQANGYANAWYIDPKKHGLNENFDLVLFYWPQAVFYLGIRIFLVSLSFGLFMLIWRLVRGFLTKKQNNKKTNAK